MKKNLPRGNGRKFKPTLKPNPILPKTEKPKLSDVDTIRGAIQPDTYIDKG
jgi:hypothetical protein